MWIVLLLIFLLALTIRLVIDVFTIPEIARELIRELCLVLMSISMIQFIISISNKGDIINNIIEKIQLRVSKDTDFLELSDESKKEILKNMFEQTFFEKAYKNKKYDGAFDLNIKLLSEDIANNFINKMKSCRYNENFSRNVRIILHDDDIEIITTTNLTIINPANEDEKFTHDPMFRLKKEFASYNLHEFFYSEEPLIDSNRKYLEKPKVAHTNSLYVAGKKITVDISKEINNHIKFTTSYRTEYNMFFQTYWFKHPCENFTLKASIDDRREKRDNAFVIRWEVFCNSLEKNAIARSKMKQTNNEIDIMRPIKWMQEGSGYMLALNERPLKSHSDS